MTSTTDPPPENRRLGDFEIVREVGRGMGVVYEARQVSLNRRVALKVLSASLGLTPTAAERFRREAEAAAGLHHTNIVPVYAAGEQDGTPFYAMELIDGPSLDHVIRQIRDAPGSDALLPALAPTGPYVEDAPGPTAAPTPPTLGPGGGYFDAVAGMIADVADALEHAHRHGVIHRDIKPSNLLLSAAGRLSVNDFGLARVLEQPGVTLTGEFVGTPRYMSPEQITAGRVPLDRRTDIYSLGATLYELLTLAPPFTGAGRDQVLAQIRHKEPRPPRRVNRRVPVDLETICLKAMDKDPDRRYQTAGQMAEDLRRYLRRFAIAARRAGPVERLRKWARRHPGLSAALACAVLATAAAGYFAARSALSERRLLAQKRQDGLEKALLVAMSGDLAAAEKAIGEVELLGASTGQVRMLRGQLAYYRGDMQEAVRHLEQAVELLPESVAALSMLAVAYGSQGRWGEYQQAMGMAEKLTPQAPEDYLFRGHAEAQWWDPERGLETLQEAFRQRPSVVAHLLRADAECVLAMDLVDPGRARQVAEAAVQDADAARRLLPANALALTTSLTANLTAAGVYADTGQPAKRAEALARAGEDAAGLEPFSALPDACIFRWLLLREEGKEIALLEQLRRVSEQTGHEVTAFFYALTLYRRNRVADSLEALEKRRGPSFTDPLRAVVLADLDGNPARAAAACRELAGRELDGNSWLHWLPVLRLLGQKEQSQSRCRELRKKPDLFPLFRRAGFARLLDYGAGELSAEQLLTAAAGSRRVRCLAQHSIAVAMLAEGDRDGARQALRAALATRAFSMYAYDMSWALLGRMNQDPTWPAWVPLKK